jgi:hypothetical protein
VWGTRLIRGGRITPGVNAWEPNVTWGAATTPYGQPLDWGWIDIDGQSTPWRAACADSACSTFTVSGGALNVVWLQACGGSDCDGPWSVELMRTTALNAAESDTIVWGTDDADTVIWGTTDADTIVWGTQSQTTVIWGTDGVDTIVWGTNCLSSSCEPVIWNRQ